MFSVFVCLIWALFDWDMVHASNKSGCQFNRVHRKIRHPFVDLHSAKRKLLFAKNKKTFFEWPRFWKTSVISIRRVLGGFEEKITACGDFFSEQTTSTHFQRQNNKTIIIILSVKTDDFRYNHSTPMSKITHLHY